MIIKVTEPQKKKQLQNSTENTPLLGAVVC